jgi:hypothetical protein
LLVDSFAMNLSNMSIKREPLVIRQREFCAVCGSNRLELAIDLPDLPLTDTYCREPPEELVEGIDQRLLVCSECGHAQIAEQVNPAVLYGCNYSFRTSSSATARHGTSFFLSLLDEVAPGRHFNCTIDVGCNDLYLLKQMRDRSRVRVGIDPVWASKEEQRDDKSISVLGAAVEDVDLGSVLGASPDLVVCRHVLEHIYDPRTVLQQLFAVADKNALILVEVPGFEALMRRLRFDQVFHQHLQYFSLGSLRRLVEESGGVYITHRENYHDWGALLVAFAKGNADQGIVSTKPSPPFSAASIRRRYVIFQQQLSATNEVLGLLDGTTVYGYGAAQMLPVLAYHLNNDLSALAAVLDDDVAKNGLRYWNLPVAICHTESIRDIEASSILITAVDNVKPIMIKLLARRPRHIIYPFHIV